MYERITNLTIDHVVTLPVPVIMQACKESNQDHNNQYLLNCLFGELIVKKSKYIILFILRDYKNNIKVFVCNVNDKNALNSYECRVLDSTKAHYQKSFGGQK